MLKPEIVQGVLVATVLVAISMLALRTRRPRLIAAVANFFTAAVVLGTYGIQHHQGGPVVAKIIVVLAVSVVAGIGGERITAVLGRRHKLQCECAPK